MKKKLQKVGLFGSAALFLCSAVLGIAVMPINALADGATNPMSVVIGTKTDNVTTTVASVKGDYTGLYVGPSVLSDDWSAEIGTTFTGDASITYLLPQMIDFSYVENNILHQANAFTVYSMDNQPVLTFTIASMQWGFGNTTAYAHNHIADTYTIPRKINDNTAGAQYYNPDNPYKTLSPVIENGSINGWESYDMVYVRSLGNLYVAPNVRITAKSDATALDSADELTGTLYFDYDETNKKMTVKTETFDVNNNTSSYGEAAIGNGQIIAVGEADVDLSGGYKIVMHNAPDFGKQGDVNYFAHTHSSGVLLTAINGFSTVESTVNVANTGTETITYANEYVKDEKNMIDLAYGEKLGEFSYVMSDKSVADAQNNTLVLNPTNATFTYSDDIFTADEDITVAYGGASKAYTVSVSNPAASINTADLFTANNATVTTAQTVGIYNGVKIAKGLNRAVTLNGLFQGDANISYTVAQSNVAPHTGHAWTLVDANGKDILTVVNYSNIWQADSGRAYLYDPNGNDGAGKYTVSKSGAVTEVTTFAQAADSTPTLPNYITANGQVHWYGTPWYVETNVATLYFDYDETAKTVTVSINTLQRTTTVTESTSVPTNPAKIVTLGTVSADLSAGYTLRSQNAFDLTKGNIESKFAVDSNGSATLNDMLITAINGYSLAGETVGANKAETVFAPSVADINGAIALVKGADTPTFDATFTYNLGSFVGTKAATYEPAFDTMVTGTSELTVETEWGASKTYSVTVKTLSDSLSTLGMRAGAQVRTKDPYGLRFTMQMSAEDMAFVNANVGEGKYYTAASYGMFILPYDYIADYGHLTEENLFGEQAKYTWLNKADGVGSVRIMHRLSDNGMTIGRGEEYCEETDTYYLYYAITSLAQENITRKFVSVGYIALETADGVEYKVVSLYDGYTQDGDNSANNVRSAYDVAAAAFEDAETGADLKDWLYDNYLYGNDNNAYTDPDATTVPVGRKEEEV